MMMMRGRFIRNLAGRPNKRSRGRAQPLAPKTNALDLYIAGALGGFGIFFMGWMIGKIVYIPSHSNYDGMDDYKVYALTKSR